MKKLPPYGRTIIPSADSIFVFAGFHAQVFPHVRHYYPNTVAMFLFEDPQNFRWPVHGRHIIVFCWLAYTDEYMERLAYTLALNGAEAVTVFSIPKKEQITYTRS